MASPRKKLQLRKSTLRRLEQEELRTVQGANGVDPQPVTRGFTGCEYCGNTNAPDACKQSYQGDPTCTNVFIDVDCWDDHDGYPPSFDYDDEGCTMFVC